MVDPFSTAAIVVAHGFWRFFDAAGAYVTHSVGVYGFSETGKSTLDRQLMTEGKIRPLGENERTHHQKKFLSKHHRMPERHIHRVRSDGLQKTVISRDIGGHQEYFPMWLRDMYERRIKTLIVMIDHRHLIDPDNTSNQLAFGYIVESLASGKRPRGLGLISRFKARKWRPNRIIILANKADLWLDEDGYSQWERGLISEHPIFAPFQEHLYQLQELRIPTRVDAVSAMVGWNVEDAIMKGMSDL
jgi:hypothetical protein